MKGRVRKQIRFEKCKKELVFDLNKNIFPLSTFQKKLI